MNRPQVFIQRISGNADGAANAERLKLTTSNEGVTLPPKDEKSLVLDTLATQRFYFCTP